MGKRTKRTLTVLGRVTHVKRVPDMDGIYVTVALDTLSIRREMGQIEEGDEVVFKKNVSVAQSAEHLLAK